jgi:predicted RNase H-like HicB family nuclease
VPGNLKLDRSPESRLPFAMRRKVRSFNVVIERDRDGFYVASVPELRGCHTQAKSLDVLLKRVREVVDLCLEVDSKAVDSPEFIGVQRISV